MAGVVKVPGPSQPPFINSAPRQPLAVLPGGNTGPRVEMPSRSIGSNGLPGSGMRRINGMHSDGKTNQTITATVHFANDPRKKASGAPLNDINSSHIMFVQREANDYQHRRNLGVAPSQQRHYGATLEQLNEKLYNDSNNPRHISGDAVGKSYNMLGAVVTANRPTADERARQQTVSTTIAVAGRVRVYNHWYETQRPIAGQSAHLICKWSKRTAGPQYTNDSALNQYLDQMDKKFDQMTDRQAMGAEVPKLKPAAAATSIRTRGNGGPSISVSSNAPANDDNAFGLVPIDPTKTTEEYSDRKFAELMRQDARIRAEQKARLDDIAAGREPATAIDVTPPTRAGDYRIQYQTPVDSKSNDRATPVPAASSSSSSDAASGGKSKDTWVLSSRFAKAKAAQPDEKKQQQPKGKERFVYNSKSKGFDQFDQASKEAFAKAADDQNWRRQKLRNDNLGLAENPHLEEKALTEATKQAQEGKTSPGYYQMYPWASDHLRSHPDPFDLIAYPESGPEVGFEIRLGTFQWFDQRRSSEYRQGQMNKLTHPTDPSMTSFGVADAPCCDILWGH